jgi:ribose transport system substrate-binding protein
MRIWTLVAAASVVAAVAAVTGSAAPAEPHGFKLGFSYGLENLPIYQVTLRPVQAEAKAKQVTLLTGSANSKCDRQLHDLDNFIQAGVDAVVFNGICGSGKSYNKFINEAKAKKIVLISYSAQLPNVDGSVSWNDPQGAKILVDDAKTWIKKHFKAPYKNFSWALFACSFAPPSIALRTSIAKKEIVKLTGVKPYVSIDCAINPDTGKHAMDTYLQKDPGLDMVIGVTDDGAYGAALSFKQHGVKTGYSAGVNGSKPVVKLISEGGFGGLMSFTAALDFSRVGKAIVDAPYNVINGTGPSTYYLNYTGISVQRLAAAKAWYKRVFGA